MDCTCQHTLVTGASSGIGRATALRRTETAIYLALSLTGSSFRRPGRRLS